jgi:hypothetical protein
MSKNVGLKRFLFRTYTATGLAFGGMIATSYAVLSIPALTAIMEPLALGGIALTFIGFFSIDAMKTTYLTEQERYNAMEKL